jgi:hypothetical protein
MTRPLNFGIQEVNIAFTLSTIIRGKYIPLLQNSISSLVS